MPYYIGKICERHPELNGQRRNANCPACERERKRRPEYREGHRKLRKPDVHRKAVRKWRAANRERYVAGALARKAVRRARLRGTLDYDAAARRRAFAELTQEAKRLGMTVDHIVPLAPCRVCGAQGAHEERNWQLLTPSQNSSKGNRCQRCWGG